MRQILIAVAIAVAVSILLTPVLIRLFTRQGFGHEIREDGPPSHHKKRGTPSMAPTSSTVLSPAVTVHMGAPERRAVTTIVSMPRAPSPDHTVRV